MVSEKTACIKLLTVTPLAVQKDCMPSSAKGMERMPESVPSGWSESGTLRTLALAVNVSKYCCACS